MTRKILILLLATALIGSSRADLWDAAAIVVEELQEIVNRAQATAFSQTRVIHNRVLELGRNTSTDAVTVVEEARLTLARQLENLGLLAEVLGKLQCLEARDEELTAISNDIVVDIQDCVTLVEVQAGAIIVNVSAYIYGAQEQVTLYRIDLDNCPRENEDVECILKTLGEMEMAKDELPSMILDEVLRVLLLSRSWENSIVACSDHRVGLVYTEGNRIVVDVEQCLTQP